jgi:segregation and condensation protein A
MLFDIVKTEAMDPWNVNISTLVAKFLERLAFFREINLKVSGKVVLAAALLLKLKSTRLLEEDLDEFDRLLAGAQEDQFYDTLETELAQGEERVLSDEKYDLFPATPQPRKRKVSVYDLVRALEKALEVRKRRMLRREPPELKMPERKFDLGAAMLGLLDRIIAGASAGRLTFNALCPSTSRMDTVYTFIPLLHLANQQRVDLLQQEHFGDIEIVPLEVPKHEPEQGGAGVSP